MRRDGRQYRKDFIKQKYCYPFRTSKDDSLCPYNHSRYLSDKKTRGCIKYVSICADYKDSAYFKSIHSLRPESERYNSRWKNLNTDKVSVWNVASIENLNTVGHICLLTPTIAAINSGKIDCLKSLKNFKISA